MLPRAKPLLILTAPIIRNHQLDNGLIIYAGPIWPFVTALTESANATVYRESIESASRGCSEHNSSSTIRINNKMDISAAVWRGPRCYAGIPICAATDIDFMLDLA